MTTPGPFRCLILACGNPLRGDDGVGPWLAAWSQERYQDQQDIRVIYRQQWTPELADEIAHSEAVIFIDASAVAAPGRIQLDRVTPDENTAGIATHHLNASQLLAFCRELYGSLPRNSLLLTVGIESAELGATFSQPVYASLEKACKLLEELVLFMDDATISSIRAQL